MADLESRLANLAPALSADATGGDFADVLRRRNRNRVTRTASVAGVVLAMAGGTALAATSLGGADRGHGPAVTSTGSPDVTSAEPTPTPTAGGDGAARLRMQDLEAPTDIAVLPDGSALALRQTCLNTSCLVAVQSVDASGALAGEPREVGRASLSLGPNGAVPPSAHYIDAFDTGPSSPSVVYAYGPAIYRSRDSGQTWAAVIQSVPGRVDGVVRLAGIDWIVTIACDPTCHAQISSDPDEGDPVVVRDLPGVVDAVRVLGFEGDRSYLWAGGSSRVLVFDARARTVSALASSPCSGAPDYVAASATLVWAVCETNRRGSDNQVAEHATKTLFVSRDGARTWTRRRLVGTSTGYIRTLVPVSDTEAWAAMTSGGYVTHTVDGGSTWTVDTHQPGFEAVFGINDLEVRPDGSLLVLSSDPTSGKPFIAARSAAGVWTTHPL